MRVVLLSHEYPPFLFGGVGTFVKDLAHGLEQLGLEVTVISGRPVPWKMVRQSNFDRNEDNITTIRLTYPNLVPRHITFQMFNIVKLNRILKSLKPDIIHGQAGTTFPAIISMRKFAPVVVSFHGSPTIQRTLSLISVTRGGTVGDFFTYALGYPVWAYGLREEYKNASAAVAVSESLMNQLKSEFNAEDGKLLYIRNGVDLKMLDQLCSGMDIGFQNVEPTLLFGGRLFWSKGVLNLIDLAYLLEKRYHLDLKIVIYGSGPMYNTIIKRKIKYGLNNVIVKGFISRSDFLRDMMNAMFVLIPSYYEVAPMLLLESMCMGKTPVMFNLQYCREFTENGKYGILADNVEDMAMKIRAAYHGGSISRVESKIRDFARQNFSMSKTAQAYSRLYKKVCS
jgi:glycosyltransferase involved in cell wall biosynthesis